MKYIKSSEFCFQCSCSTARKNLYYNAYIHVIKWNQPGVFGHYLKTHVLKYLHNKFHTLLLSTVFEIIPKESKIFQQECFRHKQMLPKNLSSIRNSSSKKKNYIQTIKLYHLRLIFRQLKYISPLNVCFQNRCSTGADVL